MSDPSRASRGSLVVVGTGIRIFGQLTVESIAWMRRADRLLYVVSDPVAEATVRDLNPTGAESLSIFYGEDKPRLATYEAMIARILESVRAGGTTCVAVYGHPGVFAYPTHESIRRARVEGYDARMLPAVSAEDCLFADLGVDPALHGCQTYEATDLLMYDRKIDPTAALVVWQIGVVGDPTFHSQGQYDLSLLPALIARLCRYYRPDHVVIVYEAATLPEAEPSIRPIPLGLLHQMPLSPMSTVYVPPGSQAVPDPEIVRRLQGR
jgi:uncharacterized protein YabN with tetrapyrrole methylase and pyrophosphatase domain